MVHSSMWAQELSPDDKQSMTALNIAKSYFRGRYTAKQIIKWERECVCAKANNSTKLTGSALA